MSQDIPTTDGRTVLDSTTITRSNDWWTGIVHDRNPRTGEERLRLERMTLDSTRGWTNIHTWRIRPEYWSEERRAVARFQNGAGTIDTPSLPLHPDLTATRYLRVRKDHDRWVAVVEIERPYNSSCTRLYHWDPDDGTTRQKWTIGRDWTRGQNLATRQLNG